MRVLLFAGGALILATYTLIRYGDSVLGFFFLDDFWLLRDAVEPTWSLTGLAQLVEFNHMGFRLYRPLTQSVYFFALRSVFGVDASGYHLVQLAGFTVNAILAMLIATRVSGSIALGLCAAILYAAAPGHGAAVVWVAAFTMIGTTTAVFLLLLCWQSTAWPVRAVVATVLQVVALLCSEHAVVGPLMLVIVSALAPHPERWKAILRDVAGPALVVALYLAAKFTYFTLVEWPGPSYTMNLAPGAWLTNLGRFAIATSNLLTLATLSHSAAALLGASICLGAGLATAFALRGIARLRLLALGTNLFVVGLLPVLPLTNHYYDYFIGIAALGSAIAVVGVAQLLLSQRYAAIASAMVVAGVISVDAWTGDQATRGNPVFSLVTSSFQGNEALLMNLERVRATHGAEVEVFVPHDARSATVIGIGDVGRVFFAPPLRIQLVPPATPKNGPMQVFLVHAGVPPNPRGLPFWWSPEFDWIRLWLPLPRTWLEDALHPAQESVRASPQ